MISTAQQKCLESRLSFWKKWLGKDCPYPEDRAARLKENRTVPDWVLKALPRGKKKVRILEVNSGPVPTLGNKAAGIEIDLVAIDSLGNNLNALLAENQLRVPFPVRQCFPEDVLVSFGPESFDLIFSSNGLDFTSDPVVVYRGLLECLVPQGRIITFHETQNEYSRIHKEGYRFFHILDGGRVQICQKSYKRDLEDALPRASLKARLDGKFLRLELIKTVQPPKSVGSEMPLMRENGLPRMISMHLPKVAGSSFRGFLSEIYGQSLRCMYSVEETAPRFLGSIELDETVQCLHGHFQADAYDNKLPGAVKITWLRDPIERVVSSYFQYQRHPDSANKLDSHGKRLTLGCSLMDFARDEDMIRQVRWYFNAVPLDNFFFIGISEEFSSSLRLLCDLLGVEMPIVIKSTNINPGKTTDRYSLTKAQKNELTGLYSEEIELYNFARYRLQMQLVDVFGSKAPRLQYC
jgi:hypothetical protein